MPRNLEKRAKYLKEYREKNRELLRENAKIYYDANKEDKATYFQETKIERKEYIDANRDRINFLKRARYAKSKNVN